MRGSAAVHHVGVVWQGARRGAPQNLSLRASRISSRCGSMFFPRNWPPVTGCTRSRPAANPPRHILDDVRRREVGEQLPPRRIRLLNVTTACLPPSIDCTPVNRSSSRWIHHPRLADHLPPQEPEVVGADRRDVRPLRLQRSSTPNRYRGPMLSHETPRLMFVQAHPDAATPHQVHHGCPAPGGDSAPSL